MRQDRRRDAQTAGGAAMPPRTWAQELWERVMRENRHAIELMSDPPTLPLVLSERRVG